MHHPPLTLSPAERLRSSLGQLMPLVKAVRSDAEAFLTGDDAEHDLTARDATLTRAITCADTAMALILAAVEGGGPDAREPLADLAALLRALRAFQAAIAGTGDHYMPLRSVVETLKRYEERGAAYFDASGEYAITLNKLTPADASRDLHNALADLVACSHREADFVSLGERRAKGRPYPEGPTRSLLEACDDADAAITRALDAIARGDAGLLDNAKNPGATRETLGLRIELENARDLWRSLRVVVTDPDARLGDSEPEALRTLGRSMKDRARELSLLARSRAPTEGGRVPDDGQSTMDRVVSGARAPAKIGVGGMHALAPETRGNLDLLWLNLVCIGVRSDIAERLHTLDKARVDTLRDTLSDARRSAEYLRADDAGREAIEDACCRQEPNMALYGWTPDPAEHFAKLRTDLSDFAESASKALARVPALRSLLREDGGALNGAPLQTAIAESLAAVEQAARWALDSLSHPDRYPGHCAKTLDDHGPTITKAAERLKGILAILPDGDTGDGDKTPRSNAGEGVVSPTFMARREIVVVSPDAPLTDREVKIARFRTAYLESGGCVESARARLAEDGNPLGRSTAYDYLAVLDKRDPPWRAGVLSGRSGNLDNADRSRMTEKRRGNR